MKKTKHLLINLGMLLLMLMVLAAPVSAAAKKNCWELKSGRYYYYNENGKKLTGMKKIKNRYYFFNSQGMQRYGWIKSKNDYYYFRISKERYGYRVSSKVVDGIEVGADGKAVITSKNKEKLRLLAAANNLAFKKTNVDMTKEEKLKKCFLYLQKDVDYRMLPLNFKNTSDWAERYAAYILDRNYGDCYCSGAACAYIATALGYENVYAVSSGGHGWCEIKGRVYDPQWAATTGRTDHYFGLSRKELTGRDPNYFRYGCYRVKID